MIIVFIFGLIVGITIGWFFWWTIKRENTRLDEEKQMLDQEKRIVFSFMHNLVEAIGDGVNREELLQQVVHSAVLSTGALSACIFDRSGNKLRGVALEGLFPPHRTLPSGIQFKVTTRAKYLEEVLKSEVFKVGEGLVGEVAQTGKGILIEDATNDPRVVRHDDPSLVVKSVIVVPINFREKNLAVLAIVNPSDGDSFGESDYSLAESIGEQAGMAIHNLDLMGLQIEKNRMDTDINLATEIQSMLLPENIQINKRLEMSSVYIPAQKVGGDLYDYFEIDENRVGFAIADVSGKGIAASLVMAICQSNLRHFAKSNHKPSDVLCQLNAIMVRELKQNMFVTIVYAVVDTLNNTIEFARAGHELPIMVYYSDENSQWEGELLKSEGMALGMVDSNLFNRTIEDKTFPFNKGDIFTLYTDGVTESFNADGTEFSNSRLVDLIRLNRNEHPEEILNKVMIKLDAFAGKSGQFDDVTMLCLKRGLG